MGCSPILKQLHCYRSQTKFAKVMFSQVSVCPQQGCVADTPPAQVHPPRQTHPPPRAGTPPADGQQAGGMNPTGIQSCFQQCIPVGCVPAEH